MRFALLAASHIVVAVYQLYLNQMLQIRWRRWLTSAYLGAWLGTAPITACSLPTPVPTIPISASPTTSRCSVTEH